MHHLFLIGNIISNYHFCFQVAREEILCEMDPSVSAAVKNSAMLKDGEFKQETFDGWHTFFIYLLYIYIFF